MRTLTMNEVDAVSGGVVHVAWGIRVGGGAALGAAGGFVSGRAKIKEALKMTDNAK